MVRREIQLCWKKEGPRWIGSGACNLIVIACRSLVNASRHLRQTTYVGPLHNARDQDGGEGYHLLWDPTPSQGVITCCTGTHRLKMLTWWDCTCLDLTDGLRFSWSLNRSCLHTSHTHPGEKDYVTYFAYNCTSFPCNCGLCIKKNDAGTSILFGRSLFSIHLQRESVAAACGSHAAAGLRVIRMPRAWTWSRIDIPWRLPWTLWWCSTRIHSKCREEQDKDL